MLRNVRLPRNNHIPSSGSSSGDEWLDCNGSPREPHPFQVAIRPFQKIGIGQGVSLNNARSGVVVQDHIHARQTAGGGNFFLPVSRRDHPGALAIAYDGTQICVRHGDFEMTRHAEIGLFRKPSNFDREKE
jgi:hypothetical protein